MNPILDSSAAWRVSLASLAILSVALGAPYVVTVALKPIAAEFGGYRAIPSGAASLAWLGTGVGGLGMGWLAERIGVRAVVCIGATMVCAGLALSSFGEVWQLYVGHGLLVGLIGNGAMNAPLYVYVTKWFERRRGTALALIASGQYLSGAVWPAVFEHFIAAVGWRQTMLGFGCLVLLVVVPLSLLYLKPAPPIEDANAAAIEASGRDTIFGLRPGVAFSLLAGASFLCCVPMAIPPAHLIAFCGDLGIAPARSALLLSFLLTCAFISRQLWGWLSDRIGGLRTLLLSSAAQAIGVSGLLFTQDEAGLIAVAVIIGFGFSGLIPAYVLTIRQFFPAREASWRVPTLLLTGMSGMAAGGWLAGVLYDYFGFYAPAFATGLAFNLVNFVILASLLVKWRRARVAVAAFA
jgi:MFS family permease